MSYRKLTLAGVLFLGAVVSFCFSLSADQNPPAADQSQSVVQTNPQIQRDTHHDLSPPLFAIPPAHRPNGVMERDHERLPRPRSLATNDPVLQAQSVTAAAPVTSTNFDGIGNGVAGFSVNAAPPDTSGDVGPNHYVQTVNTDFAVYNKSGTLLYGPAPINTLWSGFGGGCQSNNDGDPTVVYDRIADRWIISQFSVSTIPYLQCVAVSQTGDPTGAWYRYSFTYTNFPDYPKMGVWPDAYYVTFNMFSGGGNTFAGATVCAFNRARMLLGQSATQQCFNTSTTYGGLLPADMTGTLQPPAGAPNYVLGLGATSSTLAFWKFHVDWTTPSNSTFTGPTSLTVASYSEACGTSGTCIPQAGTTQRLDSLSDRLMYRLAYRNFGDHEALVVNHSVTAGTSVGVRWYEIRTPSTTPTIFQQGTYAPDSNYRWMGSIAIDQAGNMGLGFSVSGSTLNPQIHYTGRFATSPAGVMDQGEGTIINGAGSQTGSSLSRWGDYSSMTVDPSDDCTFWYTTEYIPSNGAFNWRTRIGSFKFSNCGGTPTPTPSPTPTPTATPIPTATPTPTPTAPPTNNFSISASPASVSIAQGSSGTSTISTAVTSGMPATVNLSASVSPAGPTASLNPSSVTAGGSSTLTVNVGASVAAGNYTVTVTGVEGSAVHSTSVNVTVTSASSGIVNGGFETSNFTGWTQGGVTSSVVTGGRSGAYAARVGSTSPTNGDSTIAQTFTAPAAGGQLSFWYKMSCPDTVTYDWATATLRDNTTGTTTTILPRVCSTNTTWVPVSANLTGGHSYTLTLLSHDDNYVGDATYVMYDDVAISAAATPDFTISANPTSLSIPQGSSRTSTISTTQLNAAGTVNLTANVSPSVPTASISPTSVAAGGSSTLTVNVGASVPAGNYTVTVTGTEGSASHSTTVSVTVTTVTGGIVNGGFETGNLTGWTSALAASVIAGGHSGTYAARVGSTSPTNGDSLITQTFTAPSGATRVSFWYKMTCPDTVTYDWATATLRDNNTGITTTILPRVCSTNTVWVQSSANITAGHNYTLTLISHDDNYVGDATYTLYDDVTTQ